MSKLFLLPLFTLAVGCGKGNSNSPPTPAAPIQHGACYNQTTNGQWRPYDYNPTAKSLTLTLNEDCTGQTTYCNEVFTYQPQTAPNVKVDVTSTNGGPECLSLGTHQCTAAFDTTNNQLLISCGAGKALTSTYNRP